MKKLMKIGVLLLSMIGLFTVQLDFKPILVDDDVGLEYTDNINYSSDDVLLIAITENPDYVASPLKYPLFISETILIKDKTQICLTVSNSYIIDQDGQLIAVQDIQTILEKQLTNEDKLTGETNKIEGLFRLDIGELYLKT